MSKCVDCGMELGEFFVHYPSILDLSDEALITKVIRWNCMELIKL